VASPASDGRAINGRSGLVSNSWFWLTRNTAEKVSRLPSTTKVAVEPSSNTLGRRVLAESPQPRVASDTPV
jgi:hypothetical protein